ncbi:MAG: hypothetical protein AVDCRST_MAG88-3651 [uncultured Thermomicrobiales bacterium]|uniref:Uncharacterized protein n=1 Tax=uncultured Thermomicrobiales bacterium TaxID=1645740 RepID=A0A6J4VQ48_9BACT|nr:MAG: hypothetical protein AVDCRST_MAG88-3651 [uncultured Thermomicrobiales bacterium]
MGAELDGWIVLGFEVSVEQPLHPGPGSSTATRAVAAPGQPHWRGRGG